MFAKFATINVKVLKLQGQWVRDISSSFFLILLSCVGKLSCMGAWQARQGSVRHR